jgi:hypothetical protein
VAQDVGPELKPLYHQKNTVVYNKYLTPFSELLVILINDFHVLVYFSSIS